MICVKCKKEKLIQLFYKHPRSSNGYSKECIECAKKRIKMSSRNIKRNCLVCNKVFGTCTSEINRGGGMTCSRDCYYKRFKIIVGKGSNSSRWLGEKVGIDGLHEWVKKHLGRPSKCEFCGITNAKKYDWANKSREYKRDLADWIRLCRRCHIAYDNNPTKRKITLMKRYGTLNTRV